MEGRKREGGWVLGGGEGSITHPPYPLAPHAPAYIYTHLATPTLAVTCVVVCGGVGVWGAGGGRDDGWKGWTVIMTHLTYGNSAISNKLLLILRKTDKQI